MKNFLLLISLGLFSTSLLGATITVCASGCDQTTIAAAIAAATSGDIIDVQDATHTEDAITIDKNLTIQGQGQSTTVVQAAATQAAADDNVFIVNSGLTVSFQDLTIQNGNALSTGSSSNEDGGGVFISTSATSNVSFNNVTITNNRAEDDGGGVEVFGDDGIVTFTDCLFTNNVANVSSTLANGGAVCDLGTSALSLIRCTITGNTAGDDGGALYFGAFASTIKMINCTISANSTGASGASTSATGGGVCLVSSGFYSFINCTIVNNSLSTASLRQGGGVFINVPAGSVDMINTIVVNNSGASSSTDGDDIYNNRATFTQTTSLVEDCDGGISPCPTFSYTSDANIATSASTCSVQSYFDITGSDAAGNGTAPSGDIPTNDICGIVRDASYDIGAFDLTMSLPVALSSFTAKTTREGNLLHWETSTELNNDGFFVQRSTDGRNWQSIQFVEGAGTTLLPQTYTFLDRAPYTGISYYRLEQMDVDGEVDYSHIISLRPVPQSNAVEIFPNPVLDEFTIVNGIGQATIYNLLGQVIQQFSITEPIFNVTTQALEKGQYVLRITRTDNSSTAHRFTK